MRQALLTVVLVSAALAGCIGSDDAPVDAANTTNATPDETANTSLPTFPNGAPAPTTLEFRDCYQHLGVVPVPASAYQDRIPEGFSLTSYRDEPTGTTARLAVLGQECEHADGTSVTRAWTVLEVDPPDVWEDPNATDWYFLVPSYVTDAEHVADVQEAWGFGSVAAAGEATLDRTAETPAARAGTLEASAGQASFRLQTSVGEEPSESAPEAGGELNEGDAEATLTVRQFALSPNGTVTGAKDITWTGGRGGALGQATVHGSPEAGMPEQMSVSAGVGAHSWGFDHTETYVDLPPREGS